MIQIEKDRKALIQAFANLSAGVSFQNKSGYFDINTTMEQTLTTLLNQVFGLSLINLNTIKHNHPAIDLGDNFSQIAVQVTSDGSNSKFNDTLDLYCKHHLDKQYKEVWFLIISIDPKASIQRKGFDTKVMNLGDLAKAICETDDMIFEKLFNYVKRQFSSYFSSDAMANPLAIKVTSSVDLPSDISGFIESNKFDYDIKHGYTSINSIRQDLVNLKNVLSRMNELQKWFIYRVLNESRHKNDTSGYYLPLSTLESGLTQLQRNEVHTTFASLEYMNIAWYDEEDFYLQVPVVGVCFRASIEDFDYLSAIRTYLEEVGDVSVLNKVIIECDFSHIN
ncbi:SMEK domain-containing protein [Vibrio splendidus]|uniref:SMEK domain-containing protein n=1 Tax=Vibrio splendidus TaxID=29497 RepID=UPI000C843CC4|nr:SMEK domain-containing protein [Vibrio splendidus]MCC5519515.1 SMEK domain-containing protein [Vibrio splendidus]